MSGRARALVSLLALAGIGLAAGVLQARESAYPLPPVTERLLYLRSGRTADRLMLSFDSLAADVYWIRTIQHYGRDLKNRQRPERFELLDPLLDVTTTLDPHFLIAYRFGAVFLALEPPNGSGRADLAIRLLQKGLAATPTRWQLAHDIGFVHYFHTGDSVAAAEWFGRAATMPGAPSWLGPLAAANQARSGNRQDARQLLLELGRSQDAYIRDSAARMLQQLDVLEAIDALDRKIAEFRDATGRLPADWGEMVRAGTIPGIPVDPHRIPFVWDPRTNWIDLSPESPLFPIPEALRKR